MAKLHLKATNGTSKMKVVRLQQSEQKRPPQTAAEVYRAAMLS